MTAHSSYLTAQCYELASSAKSTCTLRTFGPIKRTPHALMQPHRVPLQAAAMSPAFTSALSAMCWAVCLSFLASLLATNTQPFHTALGVARGLLQILVLVLAMAAGSLSSALRCGVTGGASQERYLWLKLRTGGGSGLVPAGSRQLRP